VEDSGAAGETPDYVADLARSRPDDAPAARRRGTSAGLAELGPAGFDVAGHRQGHAPCLPGTPRDGFGAPRSRPPQRRPRGVAGLTVAAAGHQGRSPRGQDPRRQSRLSGAGPRRPIEGVERPVDVAIFVEIATQPEPVGSVAVVREEGPDL